MTQITLSSRDIEAIARTAESEVGGWRNSRDNRFSAGVAAVVDTILDRVAHSDFPNTVSQVVNQQSQFSAISGARNAVGSWQNLGRPSQDMMDAVVGHINARANMGMPSITGGLTNFANPETSSWSNVRPGGWVSGMINREDVPAFQIGERGNRHVHGLAPLGAIGPSVVNIALTPEAQALITSYAQRRDTTPAALSQELVRDIADYGVRTGQPALFSPFAMEPAQPNAQQIAASRAGGLTIDSLVDAGQRALTGGTLRAAELFGIQPPDQDRIDPVPVDPVGVSQLAPINLEPLGPQLGPQVSPQDLQSFAANYAAPSAPMDAPFAPSLDYGIAFGPPTDPGRFSFDGFAPQAAPAPSASWTGFDSIGMQDPAANFSPAPNVSFDYSSIAQEAAPVAAPIDSARFSADGFAPTAAPSPAVSWGDVQTAQQAMQVSPAAFQAAPNVSFDYAGILAEDTAPAMQMTAPQAAPVAEQAPVSSSRVADAFDGFTDVGTPFGPAGTQMTAANAARIDRAATPADLVGLPAPVSPANPAPQVAATVPGEQQAPVGRAVSPAPSAPSVTSGTLRSGQQMAPLGAPVSVAPSAPAYAPGALLSSFSPQQAAQSFAPGIAGSLITNAQNMGFAVPDAGFAYGYSPFSPGGLALMTQQQLTPTTGWDPSIPASGPGIFGAFGMSPTAAPAAPQSTFGAWDNQGFGFGFGGWGDLGGGAWNDPGSQLGPSLY